MMTIPSLVFLVAAGLIIFASNRPVCVLQEEREYRGAGLFCAVVFALGCALRLIALTDLPSGLSAEEALVGVQGKALWQTGAFYPNGVLTTILPQWTGEHTGPLLAALTAPFVGLLGASALAVRLPLILISIAAMPAAYKLGVELSGKRAGRFLLTVYALCPYFVFGSRMTCGAHAVLFLMPIAAAMLVTGFRKPAFLYAGMIVLALSAYTQRMMLLIAPLTVIGVGIVAWAYGKRKLHAVLSSALGFVLCLPAVLTVYVNIGGSDGYMLLNWIEIPNYGMYKNNLFMTLSKAEDMKTFWFELLDKCWCTMVGGIFQATWTENISNSLFMPDGMLALTAVSIPLIMLGAGVIIIGCANHKTCRREVMPSRLAMIVWFVAAFICVAAFGSEGCYSIGGAPDVFDHANLFFFAALLMAAGWRRMQRRSNVGTRLLAALLMVCFAGVGVYLFGGNYQMNANVYFDGFAQACVHAKEIQDTTGRKIGLTPTVYPHVEPEEAAKVMYLFAVDADMREEQNLELIYVSNVEELDRQQIYVAGANYISNWYWEDMNYEEFSGFAVISAPEE